MDTKTDTEITDLLTKAANEIRMLRRINEVLAAKVEVMDLFACVLHTKAAERVHGESVDVAWLLDRAISEMSRENGDPHESS